MDENEKRLPKLCKEEIDFISRKIYENECGGKTEFLLHWNEGEEFLSLGIGHFIWYPQGQEKRFCETFPQLLDFIRQSDYKIPDCLKNAKTMGCPWPNRENFLANRNGLLAQTIESFLLYTISLQSIFTVWRCYNVLPELLAAVKPEERDAVETKYIMVGRSRCGMYPLIDYLNFKGKGICETERYQGKGWGLLQVLQEMPMVGVGPDALRQFAEIAEKVLIRRVKNAPPERNEARWLEGWRKRVASYRPENMPSEAFKEDNSH